MAKNTVLSFEGFDSRMSEFFIELRFNNSKEWFDLNRQRYFECVKEPMDLFAKEMNEELCRLTGIKTVPSVSRINRDIRFSKNKEPYRDHRWVVFKRDSGQWKNRPILYFEIGAEYYSIGMGMYESKPEYMTNFRKKIDANPSEFERLIKKYDNSKFKLGGDMYKKKFAGERSDEINNWYLRRNIYIDYTSPLGEEVLDRRIFDICLNDFMFLMPLCDYMNEVHFD